MYLWLIFDAAVVAIFILSVYFAMKKGLINASRSILSIILTIVLMASFHSYFAAWFKTSQFGEEIQTRITNTLTSQYSASAQSSDDMIEKSGLPSFLGVIIADKSQELAQAQNNFIDALSAQVIDSVINIIAIVLLYIAVRLFLFVLLKILGLIFELPLLKSVNKLAGALIGVLNALFIIYLLTAVLILFMSGDKAVMIKTAIDQTYIAKYFYENNILLKLFM